MSSLRLQPRSGFTLLELIVSATLLSVVMITAIPMLGWIARERTLKQHRQAAILEVGNLMERLTQLDWNELTPERAAGFALSEALARQLAEPRLTIRVEPAGLDESAKRAQIELRWEIGSNRSAPPVRLAAWVYRKAHRPGGRP